MLKYEYHSKIFFAVLEYWYQSLINFFYVQVIVKSALRVENSVVITWDSKATNLLGFRVVYRLFGDRNFKQGPPLDASEREFKIKSVPPQVSSNKCNLS